MSPILGRFYFRLTDAGNLIGEYSNYLTDRARPESAFRRDFNRCSKGSFVGEYDSAWHEVEGDERRAARLQIEEVPGAVGIFRLIWTSEPDEAGDVVRLFIGEAMFCGDLLIGDYRSGTHLPGLRN